MRVDRSVGHGRLEWWEELSEGPNGRISVRVGGGRLAGLEIDDGDLRALLRQLRVAKST